MSSAERFGNRNLTTHAGQSPKSCAASETLRVQANALAPAKRYRRVYQASWKPFGDDNKEARLALWIGYHSMIRAGIAGLSLISNCAQRFRGMTLPFISSREAGENVPSTSMGAGLNGALATTPGVSPPSR